MKKRLFAALALMACCMFLLGATSYVDAGKTPLSVRVLPASWLPPNCVCGSVGTVTGTTNWSSSTDIICVSVVSYKSETAGDCVKTGCAGPKKDCKVVWTIELQVSAAQICCQEFAVEVTGPGAPGGLILCGHNAVWQVTQEAECKADSARTEDWDEYKVFNGAQIGTFQPEMDCNGCGPAGS